MKQRMAECPVPSQGQFLTADSVEIIWFDEIKPPNHFAAQFKKIEGAVLGNPVFSHAGALKQLRLSTGKVLLMATVSSSNFDKNVELLRDINRLNAAEAYPRLACIYQIAGAHSEDQVEEYQRRGAHVLGSDYPAQVLTDAAKHIIWRLKTRDAHLVTFELIPGSETDRFVLLGPLGPADMEIGGVELDLMEYAANTEQAVPLRKISESIGRSKASVTEHIHRLIRRYDKIREPVGVTIPGEKVFAMCKPATTWVFKLRAKVIKK
jgi:hypothetical protein